jgi:predicted RNase H-like HicB family nuclease
MKYSTALHQSDEGYSVSVSGLPGCWSQGAMEDEAINNIKIAIKENLFVAEKSLENVVIREVEVTATTQ